LLLELVSSFLASYLNFLSGKLKAQSLFEANKKRGNFAAARIMHK
jgi:hypothetical protein